MPEDQTLSATVDAESPAVAVEATPGNCSGELVEVASPEGVTYNTYECQVCHQVLHVGLEDLAENGLPPAHSPTPVEA